MYKVLCFGDSNVYGFNPINGQRYDENIRWSGLLQRYLSKTGLVIEAGCNNRTAFSDNNAGIEYTGYKILPNYLSEDLTNIILAIGINDTQKTYKITKQAIQDGLLRMLQCCLDVSTNANIILVAPNVITNNVLNSYFSVMFDESSIEKSTWFASIYKEIAYKYNCNFIDLNRYVSTSKIDGLHYEPKEHKVIAELLYNSIVGIES